MGQLWASVCFPTYPVVVSSGQKQGQRGRKGGGSGVDYIVEEGRRKKEDEKRTVKKWYM